ncbi:MAG: HAMP domain-containing histidine kinase [Lachnospiraceae bacterium]|nr:HAMP domain-containing histidine kinase [Lachnospiraceae bacterium]
MKLWKKLSLVTVLVMLGATVASGLAVIYYEKQYNQEKTIESYEQQLKFTAFSLGKELEEGIRAGYNEVTMNSYVDFVMRRLEGDQYILIRDDQVIYNRTPYDLAKPEDERWTGEEAHSIILRRAGSYYLIAGKRIAMPGKEEYKLVLIQDISPLYEGLRQQAVYSLGIYLCAAVISVLLVFLITRRILKPLRELQSAALDISGGNLKRRAAVRTRDEIGSVARAFNGMADRIENQVTELEQESERRKLLLGSLTHELKTPMTSIIGYSDTLLHVNLKGEQRQSALHHIKEECSRLGRLGSKLMSLMGLYDNDSICMEEVSMQELFEQTAQIEKHPLQNRGIKLEYACTMENRRVDRDLLESLLINLIDNSAKASREGGTIYLIGEGNRIVVEDEGCGIPPDEIARVTEAFYMVDKARSRKEGGCGLGLALCSKIAALHGAELVIESEVGKGTQISVIFHEDSEGENEPDREKAVCK